MSNILKYSLFGSAFVLIGLLVGFKIKDAAPAGINSGLMKFERALRFIESNYVEELDEDKIVDDAIEGVLEGMDPHSFYIPASEMKQMREQMAGSFDGIGVQFNILEDTIYVEAPISGGPSEKLGIMSGDRIIGVDGENVAGIGITNADVMGLLKGPKGSEVDVTILRRATAKALEFTIERDRIPLNSLDFAYMMDPETGYIKINRFSETTYAEFLEALEMLQDKGMSQLILDLRGNPGGYMEMSRKMADEFLSAGKVIVSTEGRIRQSKQEYRSTSSLGTFEKGPLVVLIDYGSASASEIVSGAVQDHDRGLIVGVRSFGKGLVQIQEEFDDGSAMRIVISKYYTPSGRCIQKPYDKSDAEYADEIAARFESGEIFDESKIVIPDSLKFNTASGRIVYGGGGIYPDVFVANDTTGGSAYLTELQMNDLFRKFSFQYVDARPELMKRYSSPEAFLKDFNLSASLVNQFTAFAGEKGVAFDDAEYQKSKRLVDNRIKAYIGRRMYNDDGFFPVLNQVDKVIQEAYKLMPEAARLERTGKVSMND
ncbi:MAG: S41 family peptidase [Bacteroidia bacterium]